MFGIPRTVLKSPLNVSVWKKFLMGGLFGILSSLTYGNIRWYYTHRKLCLGKTCDLSEGLQEKLVTSLKKHYFSTFEWASEKYLGTKAGEKDMKDHLYKRLNKSRRLTIPWLNSIHPLNNSRILEIGCGTGSLTVALGEQGATIVAIDVVEEHMNVARERCELHGIKNVEFRCVNAADMKNAVSGKFDFVIFFAALEHMTYPERLRAIKASYDLIKQGGHVVVVDTPNRLWYRDFHTSRDCFFHWLSDEIAMDYAKFTPRMGFSSCFAIRSDESLTVLARWGRGVSYHEFVIALGDPKKVKVASSMRAFLGRSEHQFKQLMKKIGPPDIDEGFYDENLYLALSEP